MEERTKAEFRATREMLGITQQRLADELGVRTMSVKRWESPKHRQNAPDAAWAYLDELMERQDEAVASALETVRNMEAANGVKPPMEVAIPYWSSQSDYEENHYVEDGGRWTEVNATSRRVAMMLRWLGFRTRWVDGSDNVVPKMDD